MAKRFSCSMGADCNCFETNFAYTKMPERGLFNSCATEAESFPNDAIRSI